MPTLIVLRHAKAVAGIGTPDIDRVLNDRGRRDAAAAGEWLRAHGLVPGAVLCSPAARTRETLALLQIDDAEVSFESGIYDNDPVGLLALVNRLPDAAEHALLLGHNPSVHQLVHDLTGQSPDAFPTCALAVIDFEGTWADARPDVADLRTVHTPKG